MSLISSLIRVPINTISLILPNCYVWYKISVRLLSTNNRWSQSRWIAILWLTRAIRCRWLGNHDLGFKILMASDLRHDIFRFNTHSNLSFLVEMDHKTHTLYFNIYYVCDGLLNLSLVLFTSVKAATKLNRMENINCRRCYSRSHHTSIRNIYLLFMVKYKIRIWNRRSYWIIFSIKSENSIRTDHNFHHWPRNDRFVDLHNILDILHWWAQIWTWMDGC